MVDIEDFNPLARWFFGDIPLATARSLDREPDRWSIDRLAARHLGWVSKITRDDGVQVWVGNRTYGMTVLGFGAKWGSVTNASTFGLSPGHHLLRSAANRWLRAQPPVDFEEKNALLAALLGNRPPTRRAA